MRVAVVGATGVIGRAVVPALVAAGHDVVGLARTPEKAAVLRASGAGADTTDLFDHQGLVRLLDGADVVCNLATHVPVGLAAVRPRAWRTHDRLRTEGVRRVVAAAREARVRRVVQESVSFVYADQGDGWIREDSPVETTPATEPVSVGESHVQDYVCGSRVGVVLRLGGIVGDDATTRFWLRAARRGHAVGLGAPEGWAHLVHTDDLGSAVVAALTVPSGVYNVGAEPVRRADLVAGYAQASGRETRVGGDFVGPVRQWVAGARLEPLSRSLRVSSERLGSLGGWTPRRASFDPSWFTDVLPTGALR